MPSRAQKPQRRKVLGSSAAIRDMFYGTVGSYDAVNQVITTTGTPTALPTGTPTIPAGVKCYDRENAGFSAADNFYAIRQVAVHTDGTHGQVDWVVLPTAAANPVRLVTIDETSMSQPSGAPVPPESGRYLSGTLDTASDIWILVNDHKRLGRLWQPVDGQFNGVLAGTWDPDPEGTSDERPLYRIDGESDGETIAIVTTQASAADWTDPTEPDPSTNGRCTTFKIDETGDHVVDATGVEFSNYGKSAILVGSVIALEEFQGEQFATVLTTPGRGLIAKITATVSARSSDTYGSVGSVALGHLVSGVWTSVLTGQTVYNPSLSPVHVPSGVNIQIPVEDSNGHWVLLNAMDLQQVEGWTTANDQSIGHDASSTTVEWQDDGACD